MKRSLLFSNYVGSLSLKNPFSSLFQVVHRKLIVLTLKAPAIYSFENAICLSHLLNFANFS